MKIIKHPHLASFALLLVSAVNSNLASANSLRVVTWNTEHLAAHDGAGCKARDTESYSQMRQYAQSLDADIVALQEVGSFAAVERIFPASQWQIIMSSRTDSPSYTCRENKLASTQQKVAFVVKKPILIKRVNHLTEFANAKVGAREAIHLQIDHQGKNLNLLNVHLKSGCFVENYKNSTKSSCLVFKKQADYLQTYLYKQNLAKDYWLVLGDFNHHLAKKGNRLRQELLSLSTSQQNLSIATDNLKSCHPKYPDPIDHMVLSKPLKQALTPSSVRFHHYDSPLMLSDHCALTGQFNL